MIIQSTLWWCDQTIQNRYSTHWWYNQMIQNTLWWWDQMMQDTFRRWDNMIQDTLGRWDKMIRIQLEDEAKLYRIRSMLREKDIWYQESIYKSKTHIPPPPSEITFSTSHDMPLFTLSISICHLVFFLLIFLSHFPVFSFPPFYLFSPSDIGWYSPRQWGVFPNIHTITGYTLVMMLEDTGYIHKW